MKKIISIVLICALIFNTAYAATAPLPLPSNTPSKSAAFEDMVAQTHWSYKALRSAVESGLMSGAANQIRPYDPITRAEMVTILMNGSGLSGLSFFERKAFQNDLSQYKDVSASDWFYVPLSMASKLKLMDGISKTEMAPNQAITREQVFKILSDYMSFNVSAVDLAGLNAYKDHQTVSSWAKPYVAAMVNAGYIAGAEGKLNPGAPITREEFAQVLYTLFQTHYVKKQADATAMANQTFKGNVLVSAPGITLSKVNITGDLILADGVGNGDVTLDQVSVTGRLIVRGGGDHSIILKATTAKNIIVNKLSDGGVRLHADDGSQLTFVEIMDGKDTVILDCKVETLTVSEDNLDIVVNQAVSHLKLSGDKVHVSGPGNIATLTLEKGVNQLTLDAKNTNVINASGKTVSIVDQYGKTVAQTSSSTQPTLKAPVKDDSDSPLPKYTVSLNANGGTAPTSVLVNQGASLGDLPVPQKENSIFVGWYTDSGLTDHAVSKETKITSDMAVYAAYMPSEALPVANVQTVASVKDVPTTHTVTLLSTNPGLTAAEVKAALTLETISEESSEFAGISVTGSSGTYSVTATNGYTNGASYSITLNHEALRFQGEEAAIRTYNLSVVAAAPVLNLQLSDSIKFIPVAQINTVTQNGNPVDSIFAPLYNLDDNAPAVDLNGTFRYLGADKLTIGTQVAIYQGTAPNDRVANVDYSDQPISYVNITGINGNLISYGSSDPSEIIFTPDVLPVNLADDQDGSAANDALTVAVNKMTYTTAAYAEMGLTPETTIDPGDFIAFYTGTLDTAATTQYAKITSVTKIGNYYSILYAAATEDEVLSSMDMAASSDLSYEQINNNVGMGVMENEIQRQVVASGFSESASQFLKSLAKLDDTTRAQVLGELGIQNFSIQTVENSIRTSEDSGPNVTVKAKITKDLEHFSGKGLRGEVTITTAIELGDDMSLTISGTFVEEIKVKLNIQSKTLWKWKGIIPYIDDYKVSASVDLYNYTYLGLDMVLKSESNEGWSDEFNVTDTIDDLKEKTSKIDANDEVREIYELYQKMMAEEHDYFELFDVNIGQFSGGIDPLSILAYGFDIDFVVSLDANVVLGSEFSYEKGTRYSFTVKVFDKSTSSKETVLVDEKYDFNVYAMGELGVRAGIKLTLKVGLINVKTNSVGISVEVGAYWKIWGFVNYRLTYVNDVTTSKASGACYMEVGIYLTTAFNAQVGDGKIEYNKQLSSDTWPLWHAGDQYYIYDFKYTLTDSTDDLYLKGSQSNYTLPSSVFKMAQMDFKTGDVSAETRSASDFKYTIKDDPKKVFSVSDTGVITVTPPAQSDIAKATLEIAWKKAPLSFTSVPISRTFDLTWDNLASSYVVGFDSNQGSNVASLKGAYDSNIVLPVPTRAGYVFGGWYTDNGSFAQPFTATKMPATNTKLYAKWTASTANYTVRHYLTSVDGGKYTLAHTDTLSATTGTAVTPNVRTYSGYQAPATKTVTLSGDGSTAIEYYYARGLYTLTFVLGNGSSNMVSSQKYGSPIVVPSLFRNGYTFTGWNVTVPAVMPAANVTYTAQWAQVTYTIAYDLDGGSVGGNPSTFNIGSNAITIGNPTKAGNTFSGWTGTGLAASTQTLTLPTGSVGNRYYTATWKPSNNTKYFVYHKKEDLSGAYSIIEVETLTGTTGEQTAAQLRAYNGFTGNAITQSAILADETTEVAIEYPRNSYLLTFNANGGAGGTSSNVKYDAAVTAPTVTRTGYTFAGWDTAVAPKMPAAPLTYTAQWTPNTYTVAFDKNAADATGTMTAQAFTYGVGQNLTAKAFARTGYTFAGWNTAANGTGTAYADGASVTNLTSTDQAQVVLYAQWTGLANSGIFSAKYSAKYQVFDFIMSQSKINGNAFDASWGTAGASSGHQFTDAMLAGRYFTIKETKEPTLPYALYLYEADGTPVVKGVAANLYGSSLIGQSTNANLSPACSTALATEYGADWAKGLVAVGSINNLWSQGFRFTSANGFGYFISGKTAYTSVQSLTLTGNVVNPTLTQLNAISDYPEGPMVP